uniref:Uncharacterized protein n=1 Tax=Fagus sylvatica TaxID=28930 RepID=A0A2N9HFL8_FAGSY
MQLSDCQELPRFGRNLDRKTAPRHGKTLRWPLFAGPYLSDPSSTSRKFETLRKKVSQACQGHQDHRKLTSGAMSTVCGKTDENKEIMLEIRHVFPRRGRLCAQILPYSLQVDPQVQNFKKEDTCSHNMQLSDRQDHPRFGLNLDRKMALRRPLFAGPYLSDPSSTSRKSETLREKVSQAFQGHQDHRKPTSRDMSTVHGKTDENKKKRAGNLTRFSFRIDAFARRVFPTHYELIRKFKTLRKAATPATTCNSRFTSNISHLAEIFAEKMQKNNSDTPNFREP